MRRITTRFVLLIATAAVAPLFLYGLVSVTSLRRGTTESVRAGNLRVAAQVAEQIHLYVENNVRVLRSVGKQLIGAQLELWQQERILRDHVLDFPEFREITLFDAGGRPIASSRLAGSGIPPPDPARFLESGEYISEVRIDDDLLPTTVVAVQLWAQDRTWGWIVSEISLEQLWRTVDAIRVGSEGYALLVADGRLIAHGNPDRKHLVATGGSPGPGVSELAEALPERAGAQSSAVYRDERGKEFLAVAARVGHPPWTVIVEQPTAEAFAITQALERQLTVAIGLALLVTIMVGFLWGRSFISRIFALTRATRAIAEGRMDERVHMTGRDELRELADAFNSMADRLAELQEEIRRQERQVMFGRIAAGLVHDLSHPIQNIGNSCKLITKMADDPEYRETFRRTVDRELSTIKRVLDDLRNIARPIPLEHFPVDINRSVGEAVEIMQAQAETAGVSLSAELTTEPAYIDGDLFALGRVHRNLILNAIQATEPGGTVVVATEAERDRVRIHVRDSGCGIPPERLAAVFEDFVTTKRRGLGLGLAISRKIVEQLGGRISVKSEVGRGTVFVLDFPRTQARPVARAAG